MTTTTATNFRKDLFNLLCKSIKYNEIINVSTKDGNAIVLSEEEYNGLLATLELCSNQELRNKIVEGKNEVLAGCVDIDEVQW